MNEPVKQRHAAECWCGWRIECDTYQEAKDATRQHIDDAGHNQVHTPDDEGSGGVW